MPRENIGTCGYQSLGTDWAKSELELGIFYIRRACGEPPKRYELAIIFNEHELGDYPTIGIQWEGPFDAPWDYISKAEAALGTFDEAVDWGAIEPKGEEDSEDEAIDDSHDEDAGIEEQIAGVHGDGERIEIYRREEAIEIEVADWIMALLIFREMGWVPDRPFDTFAKPLAFSKRKSNPNYLHTWQA